MPLEGRLFASAYLPHSQDIQLVSGEVNTRLFGNPDLAVRTHCSTPSSPRVLRLRGVTSFLVAGVTWGYMACLRKDSLLI
jgi:hypothetical protein